MIRTLFLLFIFMSALALPSYTQIHVIASSTPSICYNDGTLIIHASGGTGPYTDSILSGPTNPNLIYPIALPVGRDTFIDLPHGNFSISVHDAAGHTLTFPASVGGTYEFPNDSLYQAGSYTNSDTLFCLVDSSTGRLPYQYAISSTGSNSGFGPYQSQNYFAHLCQGEYWVRLRDSCGNIYTSSYNVTDNVYAYPVCYNIQAGTATIEAAYGIPPFTFSILNNNGNTIASNRTGVFTALSYSPYYYYNVSDSCGTTFTSWYQLPNPQYEAVCPFNGTVFNTVFDQFLPIAYECVNCTPVQYDTINSGNYASLFHNLQLNHTYIIKMTDACGNIVLDTTTISPTINISTYNTSCRGFQATCHFPNGAPVPWSDIDSIVLIYNGIRYVSTNGQFNGLPNWIANFVNDSIEVFTSIGCNTRIAFTPQIPNMFFPFTIEPQHGPNCDPIWNGMFNGGPFDHETVYIISSNNDTIFGQPILPDGGSIYYNLQPGATYNIVSDSGCTIVAILDTIPAVENTASSYVNCLGQPVISIIGYDSISQGSTGTGTYSDTFIFGYLYSGYYITKLFLHDSLVYISNATPYNNQGSGYSGVSQTIYPPDTGYYTYKIYSTSPPFGYVDSGNIYHTLSLNTMFDTLCPVDSGTIYVTNSTLPYPYVNTAYKCNGVLSGPPLMTIYGGSIPYTIQIAGVDSFTMNTNTVVFPDSNIGTYNVIAYDNCGISRSFTFSILDSCALCGTVSAGRDTSICDGRNAILTATSQYTGGTYLWSPGGATTRSITVSPTHSTQYIVTYTGLYCLPVTDTVTVYVTPAPSVIVKDTLICVGRLATLHALSSPGGGTYLWTPGGFTTQSITVSPLISTTYSVSYTLGGCNAVTDTGHVNVFPAPTLSVSDTSACQGHPTSLHASPSLAGGTYLWTPGSDTTSSITVSPLTSTTYSAAYTVPGCNAVIDTGRVTVLPLPTLSVSDTSVCAGRQAALHASSSQGGGTYLWTPGGYTTRNITVSPQAGTTYFVTYYLAGCNAVIDSGRVSVSPAPTLSVSDTSICAGGIADLHAMPSQSGGVYLWAPGSYTAQSISVSPLSTTTYYVVYTLAGCNAVIDSSHVSVSAGPILSVSDTSICAGGTAILHATPSQIGGAYLWAPGSYTSSGITVSPSSTTTYHVIYTYPGCGPVSDSGTVNVYTTPVITWGYTHTGYTFYFRDSIISGEGPFTYLWIFSDGTTSDSADPVHTYPQGGNQTNGKFNVTLIVTSPCGSDTVSQIVRISGINDISLREHVSIYPDPNHGSFTIAVTDISSDILSAELRDMLGRSIYSQPIHTGENKFDLPLASGVYLVKVSDGINETVSRMSIE